MKDFIGDLFCCCDKVTDKSDLRQDSFDFVETLRYSDSHSVDKFLAAGAGGIASAARKLRAVCIWLQLSVLFSVAIRVSFFSTSVNLI